MDFTLDLCIDCYTLGREMKWRSSAVPQCFCEHRRAASRLPELQDCLAQGGIFGVSCAGTGVELNPCWVSSNSGHSVVLFLPLAEEENYFLSSFFPPLSLECCWSGLLSGDLQKERWISWLLAMNPMQLQRCCSG